MSNPVPHCHNYTDVLFRKVQVRKDSKWDRERQKKGAGKVRIDSISDLFDAARKLRRLQRGPGVQHACLKTTQRGLQRGPGR